MWKGNRESVGFEKIVLGTTEAQVLKLLGSPDYREQENIPYDRYTSVPCTPPCKTRLWWENDLLPGVGAHSVKLDINKLVISKYRWVSP